jgi:hypothetical protein
MADFPKAANGPRVASVRRSGSGGFAVIGVFAAPEIRCEEPAGDSISNTLLKSWIRDRVNAFKIMGSFTDRATRRRKTFVRFYFVDADQLQVGEDAFVRVFDAKSYALFTAAGSMSSAIALAEKRREPTRADWREWSELGAS